LITLKLEVQISLMSCFLIPVSGITCRF